MNRDERERLGNRLRETCPKRKKKADTSAKLLERYRASLVSDLRNNADRYPALAQINIDIVITSALNEAERYAAQTSILPTSREILDYLEMEALRTQSRAYRRSMTFYGRAWPYFDDD